MMSLALTMLIIMGIMLFVKFKFGDAKEGQPTAKQVYLTLAVLGVSYTGIGILIAKFFV